MTYALTLLDNFTQLDNLQATAFLSLKGNLSLLNESNVFANFYDSPIYRALVSEFQNQCNENWETYKNVLNFTKPATQYMYELHVNGHTVSRETFDAAMLEIAQNKAKLQMVCVKSSDNYGLTYELLINNMFIKMRYNLP